MSAKLQRVPDEPKDYDGGVDVGIHLAFHCTVRVPTWMWERYRSWGTPVEQRQICEQFLEDMLMQQLRARLDRPGALDNPKDFSLHWGAHVNPERVE